jgi:nicotinamidase-related amidase
MSDTALLVIDVQANMFDPSHSVHDADALRERLQDLVDRARQAGAAVVFVRNCGGPQDPDVKGTPGWELASFLTPRLGEVLLDKTTCDTFATTPLGEELAARGVTRVVIAGLQSDWCIRETTLGALSRGLDVTLVADAHSTYDGKERTASKISAEVNDELGERARLVPSKELRFE